MRILAGFLGLTALMALAVPHVALAAPPPRVAGQSCSALASTMGARSVWRTWFTGSRHQLFGRPLRYTASPCFRTEAACKAWLYWAQTDWPRQNTFRPCWRGGAY